MSAASNYLENKLVENVLRGVNYVPPTAIFVALHTAAPGETGINEVSTAVFPAYARQDAAKGGAVATGWTAAADGQCKNAQQLIYPVSNASGPVTVTHYSLWDASTGGNYLLGAALSSNRTLNPGDVFVVDVQKLTVSVL
jgi:hypothetical protein